MTNWWMCVCVWGSDRARCRGTARTYRGSVVIDGRVLVDNPVYPTAALTDVMMDWLVYSHIQCLRILTHVLLETRLVLEVVWFWWISAGLVELEWPLSDLKGSNFLPIQWRIFVTVFVTTVTFQQFLPIFSLKSKCCQEFYQLIYLMSKVFTMKYFRHNNLWVYFTQPLLLFFNNISIRNFTEEVTLKNTYSLEEELFLFSLKSRGVNVI